MTLSSKRQQRALSERGSDEYNILQEMDSHGDDVFKQVRLYTKRLILHRLETGDSRDELLYMIARDQSGDESAKLSDSISGEENSDFDSGDDSGDDSADDSGKLFYCLLAYCRWAEPWHRERDTDVSRAIVKASDTATKLINARYGKRVAFQRLQEAAAETKGAQELKEKLSRAMALYNAKKSALNELLQDDVPKFSYPPSTPLP